MEYDKIRNKVNKFYNDGKIPKYQQGGVFSDPDQQREYEYLIQNGYSEEQARNQIKRDAMLDVSQFKENSAFNSAIQEGWSVDTATKLSQTESFQNEIAQKGGTDSTGRTEQEVQNAYQQTSSEAASKGESGGAGNSLGGLSSKGAGMIAGAAVGTMKAIDAAAMGDKNFGAQSQAIDSAVHGVSGALMSSGNPYAMAAGAALEGANFLTKAGGQTVQGFDVNIENSGFGTLGHMESSSSRDFGAMIGLGGLFKGNMEKKLAKRNEQARMALKAAEISEDVKFEQEARMNSVDNVLRNNQIALAGGIDTSLLGS